jgi:hypothetical protein
MAKAEPDLAGVNRLIRGDIVPAPNTVSKTIEHALAMLRSEKERVHELQAKLLSLRGIVNGA